MRDYVWVLGLHFVYEFIHLCTSVWWLGGGLVVCWDGLLSVSSR